MFDLGSVPYKDSDELCIACVPFLLTRSLFRRAVSGTFELAAVLPQRKDVIAASTTMRMVLRRDDPKILWFISAPLQARAALAH